MTKVPTDLKILDMIYKRYYDNFHAHCSENKIRPSKIYVPIDINLIAKSLKVDEDIVFGRLYYHLNKKFRYKQEDGSSVEFFSLLVADIPNCINFPYLASVLADLKDKDEKYQTSTYIAFFSLFIALLSFVISVVYTAPH
ncbi:MAG: hypothetical protein WC541_04450 [Dehalococcoidia bacterium]